MNRLPKILLCLLIASLLITVGLVSSSIYTNCKLRLEFEAKEDAYPYAEEIKKEDIDFELLYESMRNEVLMPYRGMGTPNYNHDIVTPVTINYYADINDTTPAYTIEKGTTVHCESAYHKDDVTYHGIQSIPTNKRGWRIAKPFIVTGEKRNNTFLYVKTSDLEAVADAWAKENIDILSENPLGMKSVTKSYLLLRIDHLLYDSGVYLSKNLLTPIFSPAVIVSLSSSVILLAAYLALRCKVKCKT